MTRASWFKREVRARMEKTGERYTTARAHVLAARGVAADDDRGPCVPGVCSDTGAVRNFLEASGVRTPEGEPLSEAMVTGLAGGVGFLYIVFEYKDTPPLLSVLTRYDSAADRFAAGALERLGLEADLQETTSASKARKTLDAALDAGRPFLCVVDQIALERSLGPAEYRGMMPTLVCVTGRDGDELIVDTGAAEPLRVAPDAFAGMRAAYKKGKHRSWTVKESEVTDLDSAVRRAVSDCAQRYTEAPYKGYASNFGLAGMEKWARLLVDEKDKKGWPKLFPEGGAACLALRRTYQGLQHELTPPAAGRGLYAEFLREAARITGHAPYSGAAERYDTAAERWTRIAERIASCGVPEVRTGCEMLDRYAEFLDEQATSSGSKLALELRESSKQGELSKESARALYRELAELVESAIDAERNALAALENAVEVKA